MISSSLKSYFETKHSHLQCKDLDFLLELIFKKKKLFWKKSNTDSASIKVVSIDIAGEFEERQNRY